MATRSDKKRNAPRFIGGLCAKCSGAKFERWTRGEFGEQIGSVPCPACNGAGTEEEYTLGLATLQAAAPIRPPVTAPASAQVAMDLPIAAQITPPSEDQEAIFAPSPKDGDSPEQAQLFNMPAEWERHWGGMPTFISRTTYIYAEFIVRVKSKEDLQKLATLLEQNLTQNTESVWYPKRLGNEWLNQEYYDLPAEEGHVE